MGKYCLFPSRGFISIKPDHEVPSENKKKLNEILKKLGTSDSYMTNSVENKRIGNETVTVSADVISLESGDVISVPGEFLKPISKHLDPKKKLSAVDEAAA